MHTPHLALLLGLAAACTDKGDDSGAGTDSGSGDGAVSWSIYPYQTVCNGEGQWLCPVGQRATASSWEPIPCGITGLDFAWGVSVDLQAEITGYSDPAVDGCGDVWTQLSVESATFDSAGLAFDLVGVWGEFIEVGEGGGTALGATFVCGSTAACDQLDALSSDWSHSYTLSMEVGAAEGDPLVLTGLSEL